MELNQCSGCNHNGRKWISLISSHALRIDSIILFRIPSVEQPSVQKHRRSVFTDLLRILLICISERYSITTNFFMLEMLSPLLNVAVRR